MAGAGQAPHWRPTSTLEPFVILAYAMTALWPLLPGCGALSGNMMNHCSLQQTNRQQLFDYSSLTDFLTYFLWWLFLQFSSLSLQPSLSKDDILSFFYCKDLGQGSQTQLPTAAIKITKMEEAIGGDCGKLLGASHV